MTSKEIAQGVYTVGTPDPERELFDELIELPEGTSYNSYLIKGSEATALIDTVDPEKLAEFIQNLGNCGIDKIDYVIANHAEQDHSGSLKEILIRYPEAVIVTNEKCKGILSELLPLNDDNFKLVKEGDVLELGDKTLEFIITPWVHWPETMVTYLKQQKILFSCDFFGAHLAENQSFVKDRKEIEEPAKRYYAEIMMPFRNHIKKHLEKLDGYEIELLCPSHGPMYDKPEIIIELYKEWISDEVENKVVIVYVSMHNSIKLAVEMLADELRMKSIDVKVFNTAKVDTGLLAMEVLDAATVVLASPTLLGGVHPKVLYAATLLNALRIKSRFAAIINSYSWGGRTVDILKDTISNLKLELFEPVVMKGYPKEETKKQLIDLADQIAQKHKEL